MSEKPKLWPLSRWAEKFDWPKQPQLTGWAARRTSMGMDGVFYKLNNQLMVDVAALEQWVETHREAA